MIWVAYEYGHEREAAERAAAGLRAGLGTARHVAIIRVMPGWDPRPSRPASDGAGP